MRILFLTSRLPYPPNRGDRLRTYHLLRHFSQEHEVTLVSFTASQKEAQLRSELAPYCAEIVLLQRSKMRSVLTVIANIWRRLPLQTLYYRSREMQRVLDSLLSGGDYDLLYVHLFRMAPYVTGKDDFYRVLDLTDMISLEISASLPYRSTLSRLIYRLELPRIGAYEHQVAGWAEESWLISERDKSILAESQKGANLRVVPNGVDVAAFFPIEGRAQDLRLLFVGHLDVFHNIDAVSFLLNDIFPQVRQRFPACTLDIVGPGKGLSQSAVGQEYGVRARGFVPDLNEALNAAAVFIAPLRFSAGVQNKVLEAMAAGLPVVTTSNVNAGLGARAGEDLLLGDSADELADAIISLLENATIRRQVGQAGRRFVEQRFSWQVALQRLQQIERHMA